MGNEKLHVFVLTGSPHTIRQFGRRVSLIKGDKVTCYPSEIAKVAYKFKDLGEAVSSDSFEVVRKRKEKPVTQEPETEQQEPTKDEGKTDDSGEGESEKESEETKEKDELQEMGDRKFKLEHLGGGKYHVINLATGKPINTKLLSEDDAKSLLDKAESEE